MKKITAFRKDTAIGVGQWPPSGTSPPLEMVHLLMV